MARMGIESVKKEFDYRVIEITRTGTYKAAANKIVPDNKVVVVAIDNSDPSEAQIKEYTGTAGDLIVGVIKENVTAGDNSVVIKRGKLDKKAIHTSNISGLEDYEVYELLEQHNLFPENISERQEF